MFEKVKPSCKSRVNRHPEESEKLNVEIASELGLSEKTQHSGHAELSLADSEGGSSVRSADKKVQHEAATCSAPMQQQVADGE